jgi:hypothetical protein
VTVVNDPVAARIRSLVEARFIVTQAGADTVRPAPATRASLTASPARHFVSTDYVRPDRFGTGYVVDLGDTAAAQPVNRPRSARADLSG